MRTRECVACEERGPLHVLHVDDAVEPADARRVGVADRFTCHGKPDSHDDRPGELPRADRHMSALKVELIEWVDHETTDVEREVVWTAVEPNYYHDIQKPFTYNCHGAVASPLRSTQLLMQCVTALECGKK